MAGTLDFFPDKAWELTLISRWGGGKGAQIELCWETRCLSSGDGNVRELLELHKGCGVLFRVSGVKGGISLKTLQWERTSSCIEGRIPWFSSRLVSKLGFLPKLRRGPQGPAFILPLGSHAPYRVVKAPRDASQVTAGKVGLI